MVSKIGGAVCPFVLISTPSFRSNHVPGRKLPATLARVPAIPNLRAEFSQRKKYLWSGLLYTALYLSV
jgi:hypothetical protein